MLTVLPKYAQIQNPSGRGETSSTSQPASQGTLTPPTSFNAGGFFKRILTRKCNNKVRKSCFGGTDL